MATKTKKKWPGCSTFTPPSGWRGAKEGILSPGFLVDRVWPGVGYGNAFAYLFRRFGESATFDPYKQLCQYHLTTPDPEVGFWLSCSPSSIGMEPGYWLSPALAESLSIEYRVTRRQQDDWELAYPERGPVYGCSIPPPGTGMRAAIDAIEAGMRDLLRPVFARDISINILGVVSDAEARKSKSVESAWKE